jgi:DNA polymerase I-like protein with 3'-5' exonuclease and polymerase domains
MQHNLTDQCLRRLRLNISQFEEELQAATNKARAIARGKTLKMKSWRIAKKGLKGMPSAKDKVWKFDTWLMRAVAKELGYPTDHPWWTTTSDYANMDSSVLIPLYRQQIEEMKDRNLEKIYAERLKVLPVVYKMESMGITVNRPRLEQLSDEYREESAKLGRICTNLAKSYNYELELPKGSNNNSLKTFVFDVMKLPAAKKSKKTGAPSLDKNVMEHYQATLPLRSKPLMFINSLGDKRSRDTALSFMDSYKDFWVPMKVSKDWFRLYSSINPTGTDTLRFSSQNPNQQNVSKKKGFNLRYMFGPAPGREWWSCDAKNIELRLPAYEAGETTMIELFERPDDPPYFGSNHLLIFDTLHPEKFAKYGAKVKDVYASTWYQWTKNGNFAVQYGAIESSGTADRAYHVPGAQRIIQSRFQKVAGLNQSLIEYATAYGYVETMPDKTVDPDRGYPLLCTRTNDGRILPTVPLNYHVQGTAMWWMSKAMVRCFEFLTKLSTESGDLYFITMQIHDEIVFDFPKGKGDKPHFTNLEVIQECMRLMEKGGEDIGVPTPVSCTYHDSSWSEGLSL